MSEMHVAAPPAASKPGSWSDRFSSWSADWRARWDAVVDEYLPDVEDDPEEYTGTTRAYATTLDWYRRELIAWQKVLVTAPPGPERDRAWHEHIAATQRFTNYAIGFYSGVKPPGRDEFGNPGLVVAGIGLVALAAIAWAYGTSSRAEADAEVAREQRKGWERYYASADAGSGAKPPVITPPSDDDGMPDWVKGLGVIVTAATIGGVAYVVLPRLYGK